MGTPMWGPSQPIQPISSGRTRNFSYGCEEGGGFVLNWHSSKLPLVQPLSLSCLFCCYICWQRWPESTTSNVAIMNTLWCAMSLASNYYLLLEFIPSPKVWTHKSMVRMIQKHVWLTLDPCQDLCIPIPPHWHALNEPHMWCLHIAIWDQFALVNCSINSESQFFYSIQGSKIWTREATQPSWNKSHPWNFCNND